MNEPVVLAIVAVKTGILLLGGTITLVAYRAYRRTGAAPLRLLSTGFGIVTAGAILGGLVHQLLEVSLAGGVVIDGLLTAIGFGIIVTSLYRTY